MKNYILLLNLLFFALSLPAQNLKVCFDKKGRCGYADEQGEVVIKCKYEIAFPFEDGIAKVSKNGKYGFIDSDGDEILPIDYEEITHWHGDIYRIKSGDKYGLYSITDGILQKPQYTCIGKLNQYGKALITLGGKEKGGRITNTKVGIINADGTIALKPEYEKISELKDISSATANEFCLITTTDLSLLHVGTLSKAEQQTNAAMKKAAENNGLNFIQKTGIHPNDTLITDAEYICCHKGNKKAIADKKGKIITPFFKDVLFSKPNSDMCGFRYGTAKKATTGYYNLRTKKKIIIGKNIKTKKQIIYSSPFTGDVALVNSIIINGASTCYFIDKSGKKVSEDFASYIHHKGAHWIVKNTTRTETAIMDGNGKTIMEFGEYKEILPHDNGKLFSVRKNSGECGVIDIERNEIIPFNYSSITEPINGWYWATNTDNKTGIIDMEGNIVVPFEFHNLFANYSEKCTNIWGRKVVNGLWSNYDIEKGEIVGDEVRSASNFIDNYAWVVPQDQKITNNAIHKALRALYLTKSKDSYGILIDREGNRKTTIPIPLELFPNMVNALNTHNGLLSPLQERAVIYKETRNVLKHELSKTIEEEIWDF